MTPPHLPPVTILDITGMDSGGDLTAAPARWKTGPPPDVTIMAKDARNAAIGDRVLARLSTGGNGDVVGRVIRRIGRGGGGDTGVRSVLGVFKTTSGRGGLLIPADKRDRAIYDILPGDTGDATAGDLVRAELSTSHGRNQAKIRHVIGSADGIKAFSQIAIHQHGLPDAFPDDVLAEAEKVAPPTPDGRLDLRSLPLLTIDPSDARDHDDAVHAAPGESGGWIVTVAIADVAACVPPGGALDREALRRGNSVYFPDRAVPMLPERLSADLCSLKEGKDRACLAVKMVFDDEGVLKSHEFHSAIMRSAASLTYRQAQDAFDGNPDSATARLMDSALLPLWNAYKAVARQRDKRQPLDLNLPERRVIFDKTGRITGIEPEERLEAHRLIEEFMILANVAAAETLARRKIAPIRRLHDAPDREKLREFAEFAATLGIKVPGAGVLKPEPFNRILQQARKAGTEPIIATAVLRAQSQAVYDTSDLGHFGLNLRRYTHFTSPIRRYADLTVHRALTGTPPSGADGGMSLKDIAVHISETERRAALAERDATDRAMASYMSEHIGETFSGRIANVTRFGFFVRLDDTGADGLVHRRMLPDDFYRHDPRKQTLTGDRRKNTYRVGDPLRVTVVDASPVSGGLVFSVHEKPGKEGKKRPRKHAARRK